MRYTNPNTRNITWQKSWFFLDNDVQLVLLSDVRSNSSADVISVLDQRRKEGPYYVDGVPEHNYKTRSLSHGLHRRHHNRRAVPTSDIQGQGVTKYAHANSLWHGNVGYTFDSVPLSVQTGNKTGNWSTIGVSTEPPTTVDLFAAWIDQTTSFAYSVYPGTTYQEFQSKAVLGVLQHKVVRNDKSVSAVVDEANNVAYVVFWDDQGGDVMLPSCSEHAAIKIRADVSSALVYRIDEGTFVISDPSQTKKVVNLVLESNEHDKKPKGFENENVRTFAVSLPSGGLAGSSVSETL